jgi:ankyrin repeat protein
MKNVVGNTAFMCGCEAGHIEIVKALLEVLKKTLTFDINEKNIGGETALMLACEEKAGAREERKVEIVELPLSIPLVNTQLKDNGGRTVFDYVNYVYYAEDEEIAEEMKYLFQGELLPLPLQI